jgi:hypothetical protein
MIKIYKFILFFLFTFYLGQSEIFSQNNIDIFLQISKPYSPYYADYFNGTTNTFMIIKNNDQISHKIKLIGSITGDNGIYIVTKKDFLPQRPLNLAPFQTITLTGRDLTNYLSLQQVEITGIDKAEIIRGSALPEGNYEICLQALDYDTGEPLSLPSPSGCAQSEVIFPDAPQLLIPTDGDSVITMNGMLPINFSWIPPIPTPAGIKYKIQIAEYFNQSLDPNALLDATTKFYFEKETNSTIYVSLPNDPPFLDGRTYCWRVVAVDPFGKTQFKNNGKSIAWIFSVKKTKGQSDTQDTTVTNKSTDDKKNTEQSGTDLLTNLKIQIPNCESKSLNNKTEKYIKTKGLDIKNEDKHYQDLLNKYGNDVPIVEVNNKRDFYILWSIEQASKLISKDIKYNIQIINQSKIIVANFSKNSKYENLDEAFVFFKTSKDIITNYLQNNIKYDVRIDAYDSTNKKVASSNICTFRYIETQDTIINENIRSYTISGSLKYIFQGYDNERFPINLTSFKLKKMFLIKDNTGKVIGENISPTDLPTYSNLTPNSYTVSLDDKGHFSTEILSLKNGGFVDEVKNFKYKDNLTNQTKYISGDLYQYFVIDLENPYYAPFKRQIFTNSDLIDLGELVTKVLSYQLTINIQKKYKSGNFVNLEPEGIKVKVYRIQSKPIIPYYEGDIKLTDNKVQTYQIKFVANGKIQTVIGKDGKPQTVAVIDKLICNLTADDVYTIDVTQEVIENGVKKTYVSDFLFRAFTFKPNSFSLYLNIMENNYNFKTTATATIISKDPPTASLSGKLVYVDQTNPIPNITPLANKKIGLMVTYLIQNSKGTVYTVLDSAHIIKALATGNNDVIYGVNTGANIEKLGAELRNPFKDGNTIIATTFTDGAGNFVFKDFAHLDSVGSWNGSGHFGSGSGEFCNVAGFNGKVKRTLRLVLVGNEQQYYYNPSKSIDIQPLDSINIGVLQAYARTYSLTIVPRKNPDNQEQYEPGGIIYGSKVTLKRFDLFPSKEDYVKTSNGVTFYGLYLHNQQINWDDYHVEVSTSDTVGDNSYTTRVIKFPRGYDDWKKDTIYANNLKKWVDYGKKGNLTVAAAAQTICENYAAKNEIELKRLFFADDYVRLFTDDFKLIRDTINIYLDPKAGIISGRILDATNPMRSVKSGIVALYTGNSDDINKMQIYSSGGFWSGLRSVSEDNQHGYFVFKDLPNNPNKKYRLKVVCPGYSLYQTKTGKDSITQNLTGEYIPPLNNAGITVKIGQHWFFPQILMMPNGKIKGYVVNESGKAVEAYVRTTSSKMYKTQTLYSIYPNQTKQTFVLNIPTQYLDTLYVIPIDLKYFADTIPIPKLSDNSSEYDLGKIIVKERQHKIRLHILDVAKKPIPNVKIELLDYVANTKNGLIAPTFVFKNASLKNFWLKITPDTNSNFVPQSIEITNEETKDFVDYYITLKEGQELVGKVTSGGKPIPNAIVYVINGSIIKKTYTDENGNYNLKGIRATIGSQLDKTLRAKIYCTPPDSPIGDNLIGDEKIVYFYSQKETYNFELQSFNQANLRKFYGFDVKITKIRSQGNNEYKINGQIDLSKSQNTFELIDNEQNITFSNILVKPSDQYKDPNGIPYFENVGTGTSTLSYIPLDLPSMKVRYYGYNSDGTKNNIFYNILLEPINWGSSNTFIQLFKENPTKGYIQSNARIVDNSFNFPGSYFRFDDNQFYLAQDNNGSFTRNIKSFIPGDNENSQNLIQINQKTYQIKLLAKFHLCNQNGYPLSFKFLEFNARSEVKDSKLNANGIIELLPEASTKLRLDPQNTKTTDISFKMPVLKLTSDSILMNGNINKIEVKLEQWNLVANNCEVSPDIGGLMTNNAVIKTGSFDIPIKYFNLRADFLFVDKVELNNLKLGNGKKLEVNVQNPQFGIDPYCGLDLKPHFKLTIVGNPAAEVTGLPGFGNKPLQFQTVSLLSNGEKIISFAPNCESLNLYNVANFKPLTISNYDDAFFLDGLLDLNIPRIQNGISSKLKFQKIGNKDTVIVMPGDISFEGPGYVKYLSKMNLDKQIFTQNQIQLFGKVWEEGKLNPIDVVLTKANLSSQWINLTNIVIAKNPDKNIQYFPSETMPADSRYLIDSAKMEVKSGDWNILKLKLNPTNEMSAKGYGKEPLRLAVFGEIKTDPDAPNKIAVSNVPTPFGDFALTYDYAKSSLFGTLNIPPTQVGSINMTGAAEMSIDRDGFYMVATGKGVMDAVGGFTVGILIGNYAGGNSNGYKSGIPESAYSILTSNSIGKGLPCAFEGKDKFSGFFLTGRISLPIVTYNKSIDLVIASAYVQTEAGLEASAWASFNKPIGMGVSVIAYADAQLGMGSITCTDLEAKAQLLFKGQVDYIEGQSFTLESSASLNIYGLLEQKVPTPLGCGSTIFKLGDDNNPLVSFMAFVSMNKNNGVKFYFGDGSAANACLTSLTK